MRSTMIQDIVNSDAFGGIIDGLPGAFNVYSMAKNYGYEIHPINAGDVKFKRYCEFNGLENVFPHVIFPNFIVGIKTDVPYFNDIISIYVFSTFDNLKSEVIIRSKNTKNILSFYPSNSGNVVYVKQLPELFEDGDISLNDLRENEADIPAGEALRVVYEELVSKEHKPKKGKL